VVRQLVELTTAGRADYARSGGSDGRGDLFYAEQIVPDWLKNRRAYINRSEFLEAHVSVSSWTARPFTWSRRRCCGSAIAGTRGRRGKRRARLAVWAQFPSRRRAGDGHEPAAGEGEGPDHAREGMTAIEGVLVGLGFTKHHGTALRPWASDWEIAGRAPQHAVRDRRIATEFRGRYVHAAHTHSLPAPRLKEKRHAGGSLAPRPGHRRRAIGGFYLGSGHRRARANTSRNVCRISSDARAVHFFLETRAFSPRNHVVMRCGLALWCRRLPFGCKRGTRVAKRHRPRKEACHEPCPQLTDDDEQAVRCPHYHERSPTGLRRSWRAALTSADRTLPQAIDSLPGTPQRGQAAGTVLAQSSCARHAQRGELATCDRLADATHE